MDETVHITETAFGKTTFIIKSVCSPNAKETVETKLKRIMNRHISDEINCQKSFTGELQCPQTYANIVDTKNQGGS